MSASSTIIGMMLIAVTWVNAQEPTAPEEPPAQPQPPVRNTGFPMGPGGGMGGPGGGGPGYAATWYPSQNVRDQTTDLGFVRQSINGGIPIWKDDGDMLLLTAGVHQSHFFTNAVLPDTGRPFPRDLWNVRVGVNYMHRLENGWTLGVMTNVGSASDKPFDGIRDMNYGLNASLGIPARNGRDQWLLSIFYSPVSNLNFPIPGVAYSWNPSDEFKINIGVPFSILWKPTENFTFTAMYIPLTNINVRATYRLFEGCSLYSGYEFLNESYFLSDRVERQDRFMAFEQRLITGIRYDLLEHATLDVNGGYSFGRSYGEGRNQGSNLKDQIDVAPGAFIGVSLRTRF